MDYFRLKDKAIKFRKNGLTYSQILEKVPVAKSTLSLWLRDVGLSKHQKQLVTKKRIAGSKKGAQARKNTRILMTKDIKTRSLSEIAKLNKRDLFLIGVALYWAEGHKEKTYRIGSGVHFTNMDHKMIKFFLEWLEVICQVSKNDLIFGLYLHSSHKGRIKEIIKFWSKVTGSPSSSFTRIYLKQGNLKTKRKNIDKNYFGTLRVSVRRSSKLNRKIAGWIDGLINNTRA